MAEAPKTVRVEIRKGVNYTGKDELSVLYVEKQTYDVSKEIADALIDGEYARIAK